jgi:hypothetical protein
MRSETHAIHFYLSIAKTIRPFIDVMQRRKPPYNNGLGGVDDTL